MLKDSNEDYFSGCGKMSCIDIILHSDICTIVYMYSLKERLSEKEYPSLSVWMQVMSTHSNIDLNLLKMKEIIQKRRMYGDFIKS